MAYTGDPLNSATDRLRLEVGDTDPDYEDLTDAEYQYFIDTFGEDAAYTQSLKALVAKYAKYARERAGQVEVYGQEKFKNYRKLLDDAFDPRKGRLKVGAGVSGGVSKSRIDAVRENADNAGTRTYRGWETDPEFTSYDNAGEVFDAENR